MRQPATYFLDTRVGKPKVFRGEETKWQEWYFKFRAYIMCSGDRYLQLVTAIEDPAQGPMDTTRAGRRKDPGLATLVPDPGDADGGSGTPCRASGARLQRSSRKAERSVAVVRWEQRIHEFDTMSRETLPDIVKRAIITERSPSAIRTHLLVNAQTLTRYATVRAAIEAFLTVGRKWE